MVSVFGHSHQGDIALILPREDTVTGCKFNISLSWYTTGANPACKNYFKKDMIYFMMHSTYCIDSYMALDMW